MQIFNILLFWFFFGATCAHFARKRGRRPVVWFFLGTSLGLFGVALLFLLPKIEPKKWPGPLPMSPKPMPRQDELWFYLDQNHAKQGPLPFRDFHRAFEKAEFSDKSYVWSEGMEDWKHLEELPEVRRDLDSVPKEA